MPKRSADWNEGLSKDLRNVDFAKEFVVACLEDGMGIQETLRKVILTYGLKEFSLKTKLSPSLVSRAIKEKHNPTLQTLNKLLNPFGLQLSVSSVSKKRRSGQSFKR